MLFPSPEKQELRDGVSRGLKAGTIDLAAAVERLAQIGDDPLVCALRAQACKAAGDVDGAEAWYWKGLDLQPAQFTFYRYLAEIRAHHDPRDPLGLCLHELAMRKLGDLPEIDALVAESFRKSMGSRELDFLDPETYRMLATVLEIEREKAHREEGGGDEKDRPEVLERLLPYILLSDLQHQAPSVVDYRVVRKILQNAGRCAPLFCNALSDWIHRGDTIDPKAVAMFLAIAGEIGETGLALDFLEISLGPVEPLVFMHAHWALFRLGQRFPTEVLAAFRTRAADPSLALRCGIAEHLSMLPEELDIRPVAYALMQDFRSFANTKKEDAAYLLLAVAFALESRKEDEGGSLIADFGGMLPKRSQKWLTREVDVEGGFIPRLLDSGLDELDIEAVCVERAMMEEDESEGEEDDVNEAEEEFPMPLTVPLRPERNDPCWCGSGKKYKKCHMIADEEADRRPPAPSSGVKQSPPENDNQMHKRLGNLVLTAMHKWNGDGEMKRAFALYFGSGPVPEAHDEEAGDLFLQWYLHDYRPRNTGRTAFAEYLRRDGGTLKPRERAMLEAMRDARYGLYEVHRVEEGRGIEVRNVYRDGLLFVKDISSSKELVKWDCLLSRVEFFEEVHTFAGNGQIVPRTFIEPLKGFIESQSREARQEPAEWVEANGHLIRQQMVELERDYVEGLRVTDSTGDPLEFSTATYRIADSVPAVLKELQRIDGVQDNTSVAEPVGNYRFAWVETGVGVDAAGPHRALGDIEIANGRLRLSCTTRRRLELGRATLEKALGRMLRHEEDRFESVQEALARKEREPSAKARQEPKGLDPEVEREIVLKVKAEHYAKWVDESLPALGGETPREAVRSEDGRGKVRDLIRGIENIEQRESRLGRPAFDVAGLRQALGITED